MIDESRSTGDGVLCGLVEAVALPLLCISDWPLGDCETKVVARDRRPVRLGPKLGLSLPRFCCRFEGAWVGGKIGDCRFLERGSSIDEGRFVRARPPDLTGCDWEGAEDEEVDASDIYIGLDVSCI